MFLSVVWGWGLWLVWLDIMGLLSISVVDLLADLLGEGELDGGAGWGSQLGDALLNGGNGLLDLWDGDTLLSSEVLAGDDWKVNWLVDAGLDWFRVGDLNSWLNWGDNWGVVAGLLGNFLAVVVTIAVVSISWGWLAHCHHLDIAFSVEGDLNSLGIGSLLLLLVGVGADLILLNLDALRADSSGDGVALLYVDDLLDGKFNWGTDSLESWSANLSRLNNILN